MSKVCRVRSYGVRNYTGSHSFPLTPVDAQVHMWIRATDEVSVVARFQDTDVPLAHGRFIDQLYHFESEIQSIEVQCAKGCKFAIRLLQNGTAYRDVVDPIPYRAIVPVDAVSDTMENRILRAIDARLSSLGLSRSSGQGVEYSDTDDEFGAGYEFDEEAEREIEEAAIKAVAKKFAPDTRSPDGVQPSGNDNKDKSTRRKLGTVPADIDSNRGEGDDNDPPA